MQCENCVHLKVCQYKSMFDKLEELLPIVGYPFKSAITCNERREEKPVTRTCESGNTDFKRLMEEAEKKLMRENELTKPRLRTTGAHEILHKPESIGEP